MHATLHVRKHPIAMKPRVVIVGGGFGGLTAAQALKHAPVDVLLIDKRNHHLFQPLLYQVATAALSPADIAAPIRKVLRRQRNAEVLLAEVTGIDTAARTVSVGSHSIPYDYLILAAGATHSYFNHPEWEQHAPGLKTIEDATEIRRRFLLAFESAEVEGDAEARRAALSFVIVGGGPTGVELAGAIAEIARSVIPQDFRRVDTRTARVVLVEALPRILPAMPEKCSADAKKQLEELGVEVLLNTRVTRVDESGVVAGNRGEVILPARNVFWAAGVKASPLGALLGAECDRAGRVIVQPDLSVPLHPEVFVVGDMAAVQDPRTGALVPGVAQGALQGGRHAARIIAAEVAAKQAAQPAPSRPAFTYVDKGNMATIGRYRAVADIAGRRLRGFVAWVIWSTIHVLFLINFRSRLAVMLSWVWTYLFFDRGARLITGNSNLAVVRPSLQPPDDMR
jgi:NADH dehydrogenase